MKRFILRPLLCGIAVIALDAANVMAWQSDKDASGNIKSVDSNSKSASSIADTLPSAVNLAGPVADLYVNQWIHIDKNRNIGGSVVALVGKDTLSLSKVRVSLLRNGNVEYSDDTDIDGDFLMEGVTPAVYTLVAETADSLALFSLTVLDEVSGKHLPNSLQVRLMPVSSRANEIIRGQTLPKDLNHPTPAQDPLESTRKSNETHHVMLDASGNLKGQLSRATERVDMSSMTVFVMKEGTEVSRTKVASDGKFVVRGLSSGCYGLLAAGEAGLAAVGFCATSQDLAKQMGDKEKLVSFNAKPLPSLNIELGDPIGKSPSAPINDAVANEEVSPAVPLGAFGMGAGYAGMPYSGGGSGGGGGGFGSGPGGWGSLAGIGGLIAAGVILATDDNENNVPSPIAP
ncbi:MAG: hypothetical protein ABL921_00265 [Pirellula sp.]